MYVDKYAHNSSAEVDKIRNKIRKYYLFRKDAQKEAERIEKLGDEDEIKKAIEKTIEARSRIMEIFYEETKGKNLSGWDKYSKMEEIERRERWREREEEKRELKEQGLCKRAGYGQEVFPCPKVGDYVQYTPYACKENGEKNRTLRMVVSVNSDIITTIDANGQDSTDEGWLEIVLPTEEEKAEFNKMLEKKGFFTDLKPGDYVQYTPYACKENGKKNRTLRMVVSVESNIIATIDANGQKDFTDKGWFERAFPTEEEKTEFNKRLEEILAGPKVGGFVRYTHDACKKIGGKDRTFRKVVSVESNIIATIDANGQKDFTDKGWFEVVLPPEAKKTTFNKRLKQEMITKTPISQNKQDDKMQ